MRFESAKILTIVRLPAFSRLKTATFDLCSRDWKYSRMTLSRNCSRLPANLQDERHSPQVLQHRSSLFEAKKTLAPAQIYECPSLPCDTFHGRQDVLNQMDYYFGHDPIQSPGQLSFALCGFGESLPYADVFAAMLSKALGVFRRFRQDPSSAEVCRHLPPTISGGCIPVIGQIRIYNHSRPLAHM